MSTIVVSLDQTLVAGRLTALETTFDTVLVCPDRSRFQETALSEADAVEALMIGAQERVDGELIASLPALEVVGTLSTGTEHIDTDTLAHHGIALVDAKGINASAVAEHSLHMILAQLKMTQEADVSAWSGAERSGLRHLPRELKGRTVGLLGAGDTARALLHLLSPFGCKVRIWTRDPSRHADLVGQGDVVFDGLDAIFQSSDIISVHLPLTPETTGIIDGARLRPMPQEAILVNTSRMALFDLATVLPVLDERQDLRLGVDSIGIAESFPQQYRSQILGSPHVAGVTLEVAPRMLQHVIEGILAARH